MSPLVPRVLGSKTIILWWMIAELAWTPLHCYACRYISKIVRSLGASLYICILPGISFQRFFFWFQSPYPSLWYSPITWNYTYSEVLLNNSKCCFRLSNPMTVWPPCSHNHYWYITYCDWWAQLTISIIIKHHLSS